MSDFTFADGVWWSQLQGSTMDMCSAMWRRQTEGLRLATSHTDHRVYWTHTIEVYFPTFYRNPTASLSSRLRRWRWRWNIISSKRWRTGGSFTMEQPLEQQNKSIENGSLAFHCNWTFGSVILKMLPSRELYLETSRQQAIEHNRPGGMTLWHYGLPKVLMRSLPGQVIRFTYNQWHSLQGLQANGD